MCNRQSKTQKHIQKREPIVFFAFEQLSNQHSLKPCKTTKWCKSSNFSDENVSVPGVGLGHLSHAVKASKGHDPEQVPGALTRLLLSDEQAAARVSATGRLARLAPGAHLVVRVDAETHLLTLGAVLDWHLEYL